MPGLVLGGTGASASGGKAEGAGAATATFAAAAAAAEGRIRSSLVPWAKAQLSPRSQ